MSVVFHKYTFVKLASKLIISFFIYSKYTDTHILGLLDRAMIKKTKPRFYPVGVKFMYTDSVFFLYPIWSNVSIEL